MKKQFLMPLFWFLLLLVVIAYAKFAYWEILEDRQTDENIWKFGNHIWYDMRGKGLKEWKLEEHIKKDTPKTVIKAQIKPVEQRKEEKPIQVPQETKPFDLDKFAKAVARHETASCTKWFGKEYNNCFWLKNWRIAPCKKIWRMRMCIYDTPEESYEAFKKIWKEWYGNKFPSYRAVQIYSGNDRANIWQANVTKFYNEQF